MGRQVINPWLLFLPAFIIVGFNSFIPTFYAAYLATQKYTLGVPSIFIGYDNFFHLMFDPIFWDSLLKGFAFVFACLVIEIPLGLALALALHKDTRVNRVIRTILSTPLLIPPLVVGSIWLLMVRPDIGPIPYILRKLFNLNYDIGTSPFQAFFTTVLMDVWHWTPFVFLVLVAARASIPPEPYESAMVDGASSWDIFRYITLPGMKYGIMIAFLIRMMDALKIFDEVWVLTAEGPKKATNYLSIYIVKTALSELNMGYCAAMALFFLYIVIIITFITLKVMARR
ncbi:MAG: sugar ABC transporter permease [Thaumarchaeota archaeon]|nr:MAG: sugar ABC transporter permease [Nitrososphaerota archaeon]